MSVSELRGLEANFDQDFDGDGYKGANPNEYAPYSLEPGTVLRNDSMITFVGSNSDTVSYSTNEYDGFDYGPFTYVRTGANTATFTDGPLTYVDYYESGVEPQYNGYLSFNSPTSLNVDSIYGNYTMDIIAPEDVAPTSLAGKYAYANGVGYSSLYGGYSSYSDVTFSTSSSGTYYGDLTLPINYTYQKVGPREGRMNATAYDPTYGSVDVSYVYFFLTVSSGYYVGVETFASGLVQTNWGTFDIY